MNKTNPEFENNLVPNELTRPSDINENGTSYQTTKPFKRARERERVSIHTIGTVFYLHVMN